MSGFIAFAVGVAVGYAVYVIGAALWIGRHAADTHETDETL